MSRLIHVVRGLVSELKRRKVFRVAGVYAVVAFVVVQVADIVFPALHLPGWTVTLVVALAILGFPIALVLAWALEVTPDGVKRTEPAPTRAPSASTGGRDSRRIAIGLVVGFFLAVAGLGAYGWIASSGSDPASGEAYAGGNEILDSESAAESALDPHRVTVLPFVVRGDEDLAYLGDSMVELFGLTLDGAGSLRTTDPRAVLARVANRAASPMLGPEEGREIAASFGAGRYVLGSITRVGEEIRVNAAWYGEAGEQLGREEVIARDEEEILSGLDDLARSALLSLVGEEARGRGGLAEKTTSSLEALRAYLDGQAYLRRNEFESAMDALQRAVEADPEFTLAYYWLSRAAGWSIAEGAMEVADRAGRRAAELSAGLPLHERRLLTAYLALLENRFDEAERLYRLLLDTDPHDVEAWYMLGEVLFHAANTRGSSAMVARPYFERAMDIDPTLNEQLFHLMQIAAVQRDRELLDQITRDLERRKLPSREEQIHAAVRAYVLGGGPESDFEEQDIRIIHGTARYLAQWGLFEQAEALLRPLARSNRAEDTRRAAHDHIGSLLFVRGKLEAADGEVTAVETDSALRRAWVATVFHIPDATVSREERFRLLERVSAFTPETSEIEADRLYLLGLLHAAVGDEEQAHAAAARLRGMEPLEFAPSGRTNLARAVEAEVSRRQGRMGDALRILESFEYEGFPGVYDVWGSYPMPRERLLRAELLAQAGRFEEALGWYETLDGRYEPTEQGYLAPAYLGRARMHEALNRPEEAARAYERFVELWQDADEPLQPMVAEARERLEHLTGDEQTAVGSLEAGADVRALAAGAGVP